MNEPAINSCADEISQAIAAEEAKARSETAELRQRIAELEGKLARVGDAITKADKASWLEFSNRNSDSALADIYATALGDIRRVLTLDQLTSEPKAKE